MITERTLQRRLKAFEQEGAAGLRDRRHTRKEEAVFSRVHPDVILLLAKIVRSYRGRSSTSYSAIRAELELALMEEFPDAGSRPGLPSLKSIERYVKKLAGDQDPTTPAAQRKTADLSPKRTFRPRPPAAPGDECQMDTTVFDAFVRMPDGRVARPHLTILVDVRTRSIIGFNFTDGAPSGEDHACLLARVLVPHPLRPWSARYKELDLPEMPWAPYVDDEPNRYDTHRPYIVPRRIVVDNGRDYIGDAFGAACDRYGISRTEAPPKSPTTKSHVERTFRSITTMFARHLPGYAGSNTQERGVEPEEEDVLELRVVAQLFDEWIAVIWQNREHDGLVDPLEPSLSHTPNSMYAASIELTGHFVVPLGEEDYIALMPRTKRTVQSDGIELNGRRYDSPYLAPMRLKKDENGDGHQVFVHFDRGDPSQVWVWSSEDGNWITCEWTADMGLSRPNERKLLAKAAALAKKNKALTNEEAHALTVRLRIDAREAEKKRRAEERETRKTKNQNKLAELSALEPVRPRHERIEDFLNFEELETL